MLDSALHFLGGLSLHGFIAVFWFLVLFEIPRYTLGTLVAGYRAVWERRPAPPPPDVPVSVLLAGHNEAAGLEACVRALREQTHTELQIVVADDGSGDGTLALARRLKRLGLVDTVVGTEVRGGKASVLNLGFAHCRHPYLVVMDVDTSLDRDAIARIVGRLVEDPRNGAVAGNLGVRNPRQSPWTAFQALEYASSISLGRQFTDLFDILLIVSGAFGAFRRDAIAGVGGWDVGPGDDSNLTQKIRRAGWRVAFEPDAWALTDVPVTMDALARQRMRWSRSLVRNRMRKFRSALDPRAGNLQLREVAALTNGVFFHFVLGVTYFGYVAWLIAAYPAIALPLLLAVQLVYLLGDLLVFLVLVVTLDRPGLGRLWLYVPGYSVYTAYIHRAIRVIAYISELTLRRSYRDPFYPKKVRSAVDQF